MASGWARRRKQEPAKPASGGPRGVALSDMPAAKPLIWKRRVKGVPGATGTTDEDHQLGSGTWTEVTR